MSNFDRLVLKLMYPYLGKGHSLYMDNYYNRVTISNVLLNKQTHVTGTLRNNRKGNPKEVVNNNLKKMNMYGNGEYWFTFRNGRINEM